MGNLTVARDKRPPDIVTHGYPGCTYSRDPSRPLGNESEAQIKRYEYLRPAVPSLEETDPTALTCLIRESRLELIS